MRAMMTGAVVGLAANIVLTPLWGGPGAASAKVLAHAAILLSMYRTTRKEIFSMSLSHDLLRSAAIATPMGLLMALTPAPWLVKLGAGLIAYGCLMVILHRRTGTGIVHAISMNRRPVEGEG